VKEENENDTLVERSKESAKQYIREGIKHFKKVHSQIFQVKFCKSPQVREKMKTENNSEEKQWFRRKLAFKNNNE